MKELELWHVFVDDETGMRSCYCGYRDALTFNPEGKSLHVMQGETEIPVEKWKEEELCWILSGCLKESKTGRLTNLPEVIRQSMEKCGIEEGKREDVLRRMLDEAVKCI